MLMSVSTVNNDLDFLKHFQQNHNRCNDLVSNGEQVKRFD